MARRRVLATARAASGTDDRWRRAPHTIARNGPDWPGPLETRTVRDLGVTSPWLVQRAIALDRASVQLIMSTPAEPGARRDGSPAPAPGGSAATKPGARGADDRGAAEPFNVPTADPEPPEREP